MAHQYRPEQTSSNCLCTGCEERECWSQGVGHCCQRTTRSRGYEVWNHPGYCSICARARERLHEAAVAEEQAGDHQGIGSPSAAPVRDSNVVSAPMATTTMRSVHAHEEMTETQQRMPLIAIEQNSDITEILRLVVGVHACLQRSDAAMLQRLDRLDAIASRLEVAEESLRSRLDVIAERLEVFEERQEDATLNDFNHCS